jgi:lysophospholipase L1-like esterase
VRFQGTGISALLGDEFRYGKERTFYDTVVDGQITGKLSALQGMDTYSLASGLAPGEHTISLVKRTQASLGKAMFRGFEIAGVAEPPAPAPALRIEFIGDSITAGEGIDAVNGSTECQEDASGQTGTGGWGQPFHNADRSYGVLTAHALNADYHLTAVSGIGLVRDYSQMYDARTMADVYDLMFVEETTSIGWDVAQFVPDIVVVALGTNDFSPGDAPRPLMDIATYASAYVAFVNELRGSYPNAEVFALTSQLLHDGSPAGTTSATDLKNALTSAVQQLNAAGDAKVHFFQTTSVQGLACAGHPNADQHAGLADELVTEIRSVLAL